MQALTFLLLDKMALGLRGKQLRIAINPNISLSFENNIHIQINVAFWFCILLLENIIYS